MKTKFNYLTFAVIALLVGFSSCSSNEDPEGTESKEQKSVFLKISGEQPSTYSESPRGEDDVAVGFGSGDLYFVNSGGAILAHYTLNTSTTNLGAGNIKLDDIKTGQVINNLPGQVTAVHVVGNTSGLPTTGNISAVKAFVRQITSQGSLSSVNLYGTNTLTHTTGNDYTCNINLNPTVARIELEDITASGVITGFRVDGIFIDNYYSQATVDGTVSGTYLVDNDSDADLFDDESSVYTALLKTYVYDFFPSGLTPIGNVVAPATSGNVWGYNLFARTGSSGTFAIPRIVIRLSSITTSDGSSYTSPQFITIKGLKEGSTSLTSIDAGKIYNIGTGALVFDEADLTPAPNMGAIDVTVRVILAKWEVISVTPEL